MAGFSFDGGFYTMIEPDFLSRFFYTALPFALYPVKGRKTGLVIGLKNK
jgi:hypothetical protein